jgi:hypothetical protein
VESASHPSDPRRPTVGAGHEERDIVAAPIALSALALAAVCAGAFFAMLILFDVFAAREARQTAPASPLAATYGPKAPPAPRLQQAPIEDLKTLRARDDAALRGYAWVDRDAGVVRIPIERAIELLAQRGLPARPAPAPAEERR